ncbi:hypothetical protein DL96DRAFT_1706355 [Flagelloscypha sp. PMI_526]|nr:hypothetical protein DL96DRAFT_1706355 [Flagelloscypha sp. PMI_526]
MSSPIVPASFIQRVQTSFLLGLIVALILYGISIVQVFTYFERFPKDKKAIKAMVIVLCLFDCLATAMAIHTFHHNTIVTAGDIEAFLKLTWTFGVRFLALHLYLTLTRILKVETVCITPIVLITQLFYAYQIFSLRRNFYVLALLIALSLAAFGFGLYYHISTLNLNGNLTLLNVGAAFEVKNTIYQSIVTTTDILIVVLMCYLLRAANPTFKSSRTLIVKLILLVVGRGLLMSSVHIIVFILFLVRPAGFEWLAFHVLLPKGFTFPVHS